ncbi:hypothetical protein QJS04_geneDACA019995 [Acorus gramineus]|uniref:Uncharacterized protein n=1 Tax=Acorus gramineus TaxID=55184 RepID=A0AAV9B6Q7_ACOGR|nr:hypothetical protein QJS04_geneDACA019995 [Acorus gramineus]
MDLDVLSVAPPATEDPDFIDSLAQLKDLLSVDLVTAVQSEHLTRLFSLSSYLKDHYKLTINQWESINRLFVSCSTYPQVLENFTVKAEETHFLEQHKAQISYLQAVRDRVKLVWEAKRASEEALKPVDEELQSIVDQISALEAKRERVLRERNDIVKRVEEIVSSSKTEFLRCTELVEEVKQCSTKKEMVEKRMAKKAMME